MVAGTSALLMLFGAGVAVAAALTRHRNESRFVTAVGDSAAGGEAPAADGQVGAGQLGTSRFGSSQLGAGQAGAGQAGAGQLGPGRIGAGPVGAIAGRSRTAAEADRTASRNPISGAAPAGAAPPAQAASGSGGNGPVAVTRAKPVISTRTQIETREIPFETLTVRDSSLPTGARQVQSPGVTGEEILRYVVTLTDGRQTGKRLLDSTVTRSPETQLVALGEQADDQPSGGWHGHGWGGRCRARFDLCVPLGRAAA
jgi:hypothetical protein